MSASERRLRLMGDEATEAARPPVPLSRAESIAVGQGAFYAATGAWPFVSMRSFEAVTGPKMERWLVKTVGGLIGVIGGTLVSAGARRRVTPELAMLGAGSAMVLAGIDVYYVSRRRISPVYLLDAAAELGIAAAWALAARQDVDDPADWEYADDGGADAVIDGGDTAGDTDP
ncbi:MAG TPA: hypothetical protein VFR81_21020 [Longimicrobium sp.]|nr:hypothetical protein [Longimicrobium sp.]